MTQKTKPGKKKKIPQKATLYDLDLTVLVKYVETPSSGPSSAVPLGGAVVSLMSMEPDAEEAVVVTKHDGTAQFKFKTAVAEGGWTIDVIGTAGNTNPKKLYEGSRYVVLKAGTTAPSYSVRMVLAPTSL